MMYTDAILRSVTAHEDCSPFVGKGQLSREVTLYQSGALWRPGSLRAPLAWRPRALTLLLVLCPCWVDTCIWGTPLRSLLVSVSIEEQSPTCMLVSKDISALPPACTEPSAPHLPRCGLHGGQGGIPLLLFLVRWIALSPHTRNEGPQGSEQLCGTFI